MKEYESIHLKACDYAQLCQQQITTNRKSQKAKALTHDQLQGAWLNHYDGFSAGYRAALEEMKDDNVTIPRKLANTLLGILDSDYDGTDIHQDEIKELKGLL